MPFEDATELGVGEFAAGSAEYGLWLPLARLSPGNYLLRIVATAPGQVSDGREVRFEVEP